MKYCLYCNAILTRKILKENRLEPKSLFERRDFCDRMHATLYRKNGALPASEKVSNGTREILELLQRYPGGLSRGAVLEHLQCPDRTMRKLMASAADEMLAVNPPVVIGYCDKLRVYKIAQSESEALSIWWTSAGRGFKLIQRQSRMLKVIKGPFGMSDQRILLEVPEAVVAL